MLLSGWSVVGVVSLCGMSLVGGALFSGESVVEQELLLSWSVLGVM